MRDIGDEALSRLVDKRAVFKLFGQFFVFVLQFVERFAQGFGEYIDILPEILNIRLRIADAFLGEIKLCHGLRYLRHRRNGARETQIRIKYNRARHGG